MTTDRTVRLHRVLKTTPAKLYRAFLEADGLALSLAISGQKAEALSLLSPLMARGDAAGARTRAFVLALTGDANGAKGAIEAAMPGSSSNMAYFFRKLPALRSEQKAAAVNLGIFPHSFDTQVAARQPVTITPVQIIQRNSDGVMVKAELQPGDQVVTQGVQQLTAGATVRLLDEPAGEGGKPAQGNPS